MKKSDENELTMYESCKDRVLAELKKHDANGTTWKALHDVVEASVKDFDEEQYDLIIRELEDRDAIRPVACGCSLHVALSSLVREANSTEPGAPKPLDALPVLAALQHAGDAGASIDELQDELKVISGDHPRGVIYAVVLGLVADGRARAEGADESGSRFWLMADDPATKLDRRAKVVERDERFKAQAKKAAIEPTQPAALVDMSSLTKWEAPVYEALKAANEPVDEADIASAVQRMTGSPVGPAAGKHFISAAEELVTTGIVMKDNGAYRVLGAARTKGASTKAPKERIWDVIVEPRLKSEIRTLANVSEEELDAELKALMKSGKAVTTGKARGTKYLRAGAFSEPGAQA